MIEFMSFDEYRYSLFSIALFSIHVDVHIMEEVLYNLITR